MRIQMIDLGSYRCACILVLYSCIYVIDVSEGALVFSVNLFAVRSHTDAGTAPGTDTCFVICMTWSDLGLGFRVTSFSQRWNMHTQNIKCNNIFSCSLFTTHVRKYVVLTYLKPTPHFSCLNECSTYKLRVFSGNWHASKTVLIILISFCAVRNL
jgi:hypothetical protein